MDLKLETFSFRSGESVLFGKPEIWKEIEDVLLAPVTDFWSFSRNKYIKYLDDRFQEMGWENDLALTKQGKGPMKLMDFRKEAIGIQIGINSNSPKSDFLNLQIAKATPSAKIDAGVYITTTSNFQQKISSESGDRWTGSNFQTAKRDLQSSARLLKIPIYLVGLEAVDVPLENVNLDRTAPFIIKELALAFLQQKYGKRIEKKVRVTSKRIDLEFDGLMRLLDKDVVLSIMVSEYMNGLPPRDLSKAVHQLIEQVKQYQQVTRPEICMRFIMLGPSGSEESVKATALEGMALGWSEGIEIECETYPFEEFDNFLAEMRNKLLAKTATV